MRSVRVVTFGVSALVVEANLDRAYLRQVGREWLCETRDHNPVLYIRMDRHHDFGHDDAVKEILRRVERTPVVVTADISGRHKGDEEVRAFVSSLLTPFAGVAFDDYGGPWTLDEIRTGAMKQGHPFFDYQGWYDERHGELVK